MKLSSYVIFLLCFLLNSSIIAQEAENSISMEEVQAHLRFLAADELRGRKTGEIGNWVAARYIAEQFRQFGAKSGNGTDYFQVIPFADITPPKQGSLKVGEKLFDIADRLLVRFAPDGTVSGELVYLPHAMPGEVTKAVSGKWILTNIGDEGMADPQAAFALSALKKKKLQEMGALGLIEIYQGRHPWNLIKRFFGSGAMQIMEEGEDLSFPTLVVNDALEREIKDLSEGKNVQVILETVGTSIKRKPSPNVIGMITGTDPVLSKEFVVLSAHFDHVGTSQSSDRPATQTDSIFNGARDNAFGVTALLSAAKVLANHPPKRSVLLLALTAEEIGLVGSKYFVEHPTVPLQNLIFNLNTDGAGQSDSTIVAVMGLNRVGAVEEITMACQAFGLEPFADPAPEQNLFDRSDNVSFAAVGIPAPTFSPGFRQFDNSILKHYHQPSDEVETLDFKYVLKFCRAFALTARKIADKSQRPHWIDGDKYQPAFIQLYGGTRNESHD
ncbi:MAG: M28 family peptidase [Saprospiraceae bacterium]|nr:M28 family peptidase [Saprospiraceae bacterium]